MRAYDGDHGQHRMGAGIAKTVVPASFFTCAPHCADVPVMNTIDRG
jgi:hypothetical protein